MRKIILASSSRRRREILERAGIPFIADPPNTEEDMRQKLSPRQLVMRLALQKAMAVAVRHPDAIVIGADTVVALGKQVWSKPESEKEARRMIGTLAGKTHDIWTGFAIIDTKKGRRSARAVKTRVTFRPLSPREVKAYVARGESLDGAGGYQLQENGTVLLERIVGDYNTIIGLPLAAVLEELKKFGIRS